MASSSLNTLDYSNKKIKDTLLLSNVLNKVFQKELITTINLSNSSLINLPEQELLSLFTNVKHLDISYNPFEIDIYKIAQILQSFPNLETLIINTNSQRDKQILYTSLPKLNHINNELRSNESIEFSFQSQYPKIIKFIQESLIFIKSKLPLLEIFYASIRSLLYESVKSINYHQTQTRISYLISIHSSLYDIYSFIYNFLIENVLLKKNQLNEGDFITKLLNEIKTEISFNHNMIVNLSFQALNIFKRDILSYNTSLINEKDNEISQLKKQIEGHCEKANKINKEIKWFQKENQFLYENIQKSKEENTALLNKIISKANNIYDETFDKMIIKTEPNSQLQPQLDTQTSVEMKKPLTSSSKSSKHSNSLSKKIKGLNTTLNKIIPLQSLLEIINEIYASKKQQNEKNKQNKIPLETLEQHLYTYLNNKYGLKKIIIEKAFNIFTSIKEYAQQNMEVCLFGKILRNEMDESAIDIVNQIHLSLNNLILCNNNTNMIIEDSMIVNIAKGLFGKSQKTLSLFMKKINELKQQQKIINYDVLFNLILEMHIITRRDYLKKVTLLFKAVDEDKNGIITEEEVKNILGNIYDKVKVQSTSFSKEVFQEYYISKINPNKCDIVIYSEFIRGLAEIPPFSLGKNKSNILDCIA